MSNTGLKEVEINEGTNTPRITTRDRGRVSPTTLTLLSDNTLVLGLEWFATLAGDLGTMHVRVAL